MVNPGTHRIDFRFEAKFTIKQVLNTLQNQLKMAIGYLTGGGVISRPIVHGNYEGEWCLNYQYQSAYQVALGK